MFAREAPDGERHSHSCLSGRSVSAMCHSPQPATRRAGCLGRAIEASVFELQLYGANTWR